MRATAAARAGATGLLLALTAAAPGAAAAAPAVRAAASIPPLADLVRQVGGPLVEVATLLPPGASPHTFEPTTGTARALAGSRLVFLAGAGLDAWVARLAAAAAPGATVVDLSAGIPLIHGTAGGRGAEAGANPHYWLDPVLAAGLAGAIEAALSAAHPAGRELFERRGRELRQRLAGLDAEFREALGALAERRIVTFHDSWPYLARRYGLEVAGVIELSPGREPGPRHLARIVGAIRGLGVRAVFGEPQLPPRPAEAVAREAGVALVTLDPLGGTPGREGYLELMRHNLGQLLRGLGGGP